MSKPHTSRPPSQRQLRVNEEVRHALAWTLERGDLRDPVLAQTPVTVTEVRTSPDLRNATVFVTPLGGGDPRPVLEALRRAKAFLRHELARRIEMKYVPNLSFEADTSFDEASHIDRILHSPEVLRDIDPDRLASDDEDEDDAEGHGDDLEERGHGA